MPTPKDPAIIRKAIDTLDELMALEAKQIETQKELKRALLIMLAAPAVDFSGKVRTDIRGRLHYSHLMGDTPSKDTTFHVIPEIGEEVIVPLFDVHPDLWRDNMFRNLKRHMPGTYAKIVEKWQLGAPNHAG